MNLHLAQITSLPFQYDAVRNGGSHQGAAEILGVDTRRGVHNRALGRRVASFLAYLAALPRRMAERDELSNSTDREMADMGLTHSDIGRIHDPKFAAEFAAARSTGESLKWL